MGVSLPHHLDGCSRPSVQAPSLSTRDEARAGAIGDLVTPSASLGNPVTAGNGVLREPQPAHLRDLRTVGVYRAANVQQSPSVEDRYHGKASSGEWHRLGHGGGLTGVHLPTEAPLRCLVLSDGLRKGDSEHVPVDCLSYGGLDDWRGGGWAGVKIGVDEAVGVIGVVAVCCGRVMEDDGGKSFRHGSVDSAELVCWRTGSDWSTG